MIQRSPSDLARCPLLMLWMGRLWHVVRRNNTADPLANAQLDHASAFSSLRPYCCRSRVWIWTDLRFRIDSGKLHCRAFAKLRNAQLMKTERSEGHHEAVKALALSELAGDGDYPVLEFGHAGLVLSGQQ
jgi:hypothetical protein